MHALSSALKDKRPAVAVMVSGGLDSVVLAAAEAQEQDVQPIHVGSGLRWEATERALLERFIDAYRAPHAILPLAKLELPIGDIYPKGHWAFSGVPPAYGTPTEDLYLVGRNVGLLAKAGIYCAVAGIHRIAMGQLGGNPFPDATSEFFATMARALSLGLNHRLEIVYPFIEKTKEDVIRLGASLHVPFEFSLSCLKPTESGHCGECNKCGERREGFIASGISDPTVYERVPQDRL